MTKVKLVEKIESMDKALVANSDLMEVVAKKLGYECFAELASEVEENFTDEEKDSKEYKLLAEYIGIEGE